MTNQLRKIPSLSELHHDVITAFKNDSLKLLLNQEPHDSWIKKHPFTKIPYIPIDKVEFMLDRIFQEWKVEILREGVMWNSVYIVVRLHYKDPVSGDWRFHDGVGAKSCQLDSGAKASDMASIKDFAVMLALPTAKSLAIKDACDHLGKLFGKDLNRKDTVKFAGAYSSEPVPESNNNYTPTENDLPL